MRACLLETLAVKQALGNRQLNLSNYLEMTFPRGQQLSSLCIFAKSPLVRYRGRIGLSFSIAHSKRKTYELLKMWSWNSWSFLFLFCVSVMRQPQSQFRSLCWITIGFLSNALGAIMSVLYSVQLVLYSQAY